MAAPTGGKEGGGNPGLRQAAGSRRGGGCPGCAGGRAVKRCGRAREPSWPIEEVPGDPSEAFFHGLDLIHQPPATRAKSETFVPIVMFVAHGGARKDT
jgi:hypothetical protein